MNTHVPRMLPAMLLVAATGCGLFGGKPTTEISANNAERRYRWNATLATPSELAGVMQVRGTATWAREGENGSVARIDISNATPGGEHPWHIHQGRCGDNGPIVGDASAYPTLKVNKDGKASAKAELGIPRPSTGDYYVNVHALATNMGTIISCGNLAPPVE